MTELLKTNLVQTPDGKIFESRAEAVEHMRRPHKTVAINKMNSNNVDLTNWILDNEDTIKDIYDANRIRRVTKSERKQLEKALAAVQASGEKAFAFITANAAALAESFRWPAVKRASEEEAAAKIREQFIELCGGPENVSLAEWLIANKEQLLNAFEAGKEKKEINQKARDGLAAYRAEQQRKKAEADAAKAAQEPTAEPAVVAEEQVV